MTSSPKLHPGPPVYRLSRQFLQFFGARRSLGRSLALIAVIGTEGSSYSKAGHLVLVDEDGHLAGLVSGGCLETDLARRAADALRRAERAFVEYDLRNEDGIFGLGVGCDGVVRLLIEPLTPANHYEPLASTIDKLDGPGPAHLPLHTHPEWTETLNRVRLLRPGNVLLLGAGPDAPPLLQMIDALGWTITVSDHRPHFVDVLQPPASVTAHCCPAESLTETINLEGFDAAVIMSHNLASDRTYLEVLAQSDIGFIGLLGPRRRRDRLLAELGDETAALLELRLRAPVGRPIGGRGPAAIALEIVAQLQEYVCSLEVA